jgi:threonine/homoserine/homoserine lactone efflux protein
LAIRGDCPDDPEHSRTTNTLLATSAATSGVRRSLLLLPAEAMGHLVAILVLGLALGRAIASSPMIGAILRLAVGVYLFYLAFKLWREGSTAIGGAAKISPFQVFIVTLLNPKALIFALGVVPFGRPHVWIYLLAFVAILSPVGIGWLTIGAGLGRVAQSGGQARLIPRIGSAVIAVFASLVVTAPFLR